ncbi:DUF4105 domain-containing protein [Pseudoalteromonas sp. JBTF-M23]|uniref:DUF4105 domain-containing protein n=1 Tax=Pseudoalteromonas caenipelagi TaxID=2726988 RepID=A0A849VHF3_9GAMM|nr:DUF4105 domain-containing protein [Pseudoalteromonas caenipelagi]NOU51151.1 DUF4105 domain-containing protein [Pseudoalteromonas caenipelagi]
MTESDLAVFRALLHKKESTIAVQDETFFAFSRRDNVEVELRSSLKVMLDDKKEKDAFVCTFPARALWISKHYSEVGQVSFDHCDDLKHYLKSVNTDSISLVYASENLVSPSSFMGHSFLKLNSKSGREHAVSYFTDVDSINVPKLLFESIVTGKQGHFVVSPYSESEQFYGKVESRNIYEYHLGLSEYEVKLITLHLWELKNRRIDYFFHTHNCATITLDILGIIEPNMIQSQSSWLTPLDVVKVVNQSRLVSRSTITPSLNWQLRAYGKNLSSGKKRQFNRQLISGQVPRLNGTEADMLLTGQYLLALNQYLFDQKKITKELWQLNNRKISNLIDSVSSLEIDVGNFKNPLNRLGDSQLSFSLFMNNQSPYLSIKAIPASHLVSDDNRHAFSESSLQLISPKIIISDDKVKLDEFTLYGISQYIPYEPAVNGLSGYFSMAYSGFNAHSFKNESKIFVDGGIGFSFQPMAALQYYGTLGGALVTDARKLWLESKLEAGLFAYLRGNNKLNLSVKWVFNENNQHQGSVKIELGNTFTIDADQAMLFGVNYSDWHEPTSNLTLFVGYKLYF